MLNRPHARQIRNLSRLIQCDQGDSVVGANVVDETERLVERYEPRCMELFGMAVLDADGTDGAACFQVIGPRGIKADVNVHTRSSWHPLPAGVGQKHHYF
jgi:hypothetical protein